MNLRCRNKLKAGLEFGRSQLAYSELLESKQNLQIFLSSLFLCKFFLCVTWSLSFLVPSRSLYRIFKLLCSPLQTCFTYCGEVKSSQKFLCLISLNASPVRLIGETGCFLCVFLRQVPSRI
jgi:hypothetical protein